MNEQSSAQFRFMKWKWVLELLRPLFCPSSSPVFAVLWSFDFNRLKPHLIQLVKQETGRTSKSGAAWISAELKTVAGHGRVVLQNAASGSSPEMIRSNAWKQRFSFCPAEQRDSDHPARAGWNRMCSSRETSQESGTWNSTTRDVLRRTLAQGFALPKLGLSSGADWKRAE